MPAVTAKTAWNADTGARTWWSLPAASTAVSIAIAKALAARCNAVNIALAWPVSAAGIRAYAAAWVGSIT